jgi:hypothetical protein
MRIVQAPETFEANQLPWPRLFIGGGISNCPDWQSSMMVLLIKRGFKGTLINPRRDEVIESQAEAEHQIRWEFEALKMADGYLFWFPKETLCPITLFELGRWSWANKPIFVGTHVDYERKLDVRTQMALLPVTPSVKHTISDVAWEVVREWPTAFPS